MLYSISMLTLIFHCIYIAVTRITLLTTIMKLVISPIVIMNVLFLTQNTLCLNPPPNNMPASPVSNVAPAGNISPVSDVKLGGSNANNGPTTGGASNSNAGNAPVMANNNPSTNGNLPKPNNNGLQPGTQSNVPNGNGNNGANSNQGGSNTGVLANGAGNNLGTTSSGSINRSGSNNQNSTGVNSAKSGVIGGKDKYHSLGHTQKCVFS